mgnify:CR=1 FL=1
MIHRVCFSILKGTYNQFTAIDSSPILFLNTSVYSLVTQAKPSLVLRKTFGLLNCASLAALVKKENVSQRSCTDTEMANLLTRLIALKQNIDVSSLPENCNI